MDWYQGEEVYKHRPRVVEDDVVRQRVLQREAGALQFGEQTEMKQHRVLVHVRGPLVRVRRDELAVLEVTVRTQHGLNDALGREVCIEIFPVQLRHFRLVVLADLAVDNVA
jgi:hypothetical protein